MPIEISLEIDYSEVEATINRLMLATDPYVINNLSARTAWKQVKIKYAQRFKSQVNNDSEWQQAKRAVGDQLPIGAEPGFLTGTTYRAIDTLVNNEMGSIILSGMWPQGSGKAEEKGMSEAEYGRDRGEEVNAHTSKRYFKWGEECGLEYVVNTAFLPRYINSEDMATAHYGPQNKPPIEFMYLDSEDEAVIDRNLNDFMAAMVEGDIAKLDTVSNRLRFRERTKKRGGGGALSETPHEELMDALKREVQATPKTNMYKSNPVSVPVENIFVHPIIEAARSQIMRDFNSMSDMKGYGKLRSMSEREQVDYYMDSIISRRDSGSYRSIFGTTPPWDRWREEDD